MDVKKTHDHLNSYRKGLPENPICHYKNPRECRTKETHLNVIIAIHGKPRANIILNREKLEAIPLKVKNKIGCPLLILLILYLK